MKAKTGPMRNIRIINNSVIEESLAPAVSHSPAVEKLRHWQCAGEKVRSRLEVVAVAVESRPLERMQFTFVVEQPETASLEPSRSLKRDTAIRRMALSTLSAATGNVKGDCYASTLARDAGAEVGGAEHRAKRWSTDSQVGAATILIQV